MFWTRLGTQVLECEIRSVARQAAGPALLVKVAEPAPPAVFDNPVGGGPRPMDDAATLREIARRIREGERALSTASGAVAVTPAATHAAREMLPGEPATPPMERAPVILPAAAAFMPDTTAKPGNLTEDDIARLAHELKTPLSAIAAASEIMRDERLGEIGNERYRDYAAGIHSGARHALEIIERLLTRGGGEAANAGLHMSFAPIDVNDLAASCLSSMQPLAQTAGLKLHSDLAPELKPLTADATSLRQILLNLLTNAVKFARPGGEVRLVTRADAAGAISIEVRDTGSGMSRFEIARALHSHSNPSPSPRPGGGMGLGLPLVRSLVEANAGRMSIDSAPGKGTAVIVTFPRNRLIAV